jgi:hypothetical protein
MARWHTTEWDLLPEKAFQPRGWRGGMTLEGGKGGGSAPSPDPNIGIAQKQLADIANEQWNYFKSDIYPEMTRAAKVQEVRADQQWAQDKKISDFNFDQAQQAYARYEQGAIPAMEALKRDADQYNEAGYQEQLAQQTRGDMDLQFENQRQAQSMRQQAYGIDPTSGVAQSNSNALAVQQAAATAAAMNQTRQAAHELGLQKQANVYNMYAGLPAQANANTAMTLNANAAGLNAGQTAISGFGATAGAMGNAANSAQQGFGQVGQLGVQKYNADVSAWNAQQQANAASSAGWGSAIGGVAMAAAYF